MPDCFAEVYPKIRAFMRRSLTAPITDAEFCSLAIELFEAQRKGNAAYARLCAANGVKDISNWTEIPCAPTAAFKEMELTALAIGERERVFYSSGTTQRERSRHFHSRRSLELYEDSLWLWFERNFRERMDVDWIFLTPPAAQAPNSSLVHMFESISARQKSARFFGFADGEGIWQLESAAVLNRLNKSDRPVGIFGTAFQFVHLLDGLAGVDLKLPPGSWILETGGYKGRSREVPKAELRRMLSERLGAQKIFSEYGMSELSSQAYDHGDGFFRFPPWARARVISPETGREANEGERGLIQVFDLANIWSVMAVQTEDIGIKMGDAFSLAGRAAVAEARGCSLMNR